MKPRDFGLALLLIALTAAPTYAGPLCGTGGSLTPAGYQQLTVSTTATALTIPTNAIYAIITVETNGIRWRDDGTAPTTSVGMPQGVSNLPQTFTLCGKASLTNAQLIRISSDSSVSVSYYK